MLTGMEIHDADAATPMVPLVESLTTCPLCLSAQDKLPSRGQELPELSYWTVQCRGLFRCPVNMCPKTQLAKEFKGLTRTRYDGFKETQGLPALQ